VNDQERYGASMSIRRSERPLRPPWNEVELVLKSTAPAQSREEERNSPAPAHASCCMFVTVQYRYEAPGGNYGNLPEYVVQALRARKLRRQQRIELPIRYTRRGLCLSYLGDPQISSDFQGVRLAEPKRPHQKFYRRPSGVIYFLKAASKATARKNG